MKTEYKFTDGQRVKFDNGVVTGTGYIIGACNTGQPFIGINYMIEVNIGACSIKLPNDEYPFTVIPMFECHIEKVN